MTEASLAVARSLRAALNLYEWHLALALLRREARAGRLPRVEALALYAVAKATRAGIRKLRAERGLPPWPKVMERVRRRRERPTSRMFD